ncbi:hypothetical protein J6590_063836 [Homalodisca vitripennis]|nr:hypothetical protein J6590_063836 [Homalodisca vitripennis]
MDIQHGHWWFIKYKLHVNPQFLQDYSQAANYTVDCRLHGCTSPSQNPVKLLTSSKLHSRLPPPWLHVNPQFLQDSSQAANYTVDCRLHGCTSPSQNPVKLLTSSKLHSRLPPPWLHVNPQFLQDYSQAANYTVDCRLHGCTSPSQNPVKLLTSSKLHSRLPPSWLHVNAQFLQDYSQAANYTVDCRLHGCTSPSQNPAKLLTISKLHSRLPPPWLLVTLAESLPARLLTISKLHSRLPPPWLHVTLAESCKITHNQILQNYSQSLNYTVDCRLHGCTSPSQNPAKLLTIGKLHSRLPPPWLLVTLAESRKITHKHSCKITHKPQTTQLTAASMVARHPRKILILQNYSQSVNYTVDCRLHGCSSPSQNPVKLLTSSKLHSRLPPSWLHVNAQFLQDYSQSVNYTVDCRLHGCTSPSQNPAKLLTISKLHSRLPPPWLHVTLAESCKITHNQILQNYSQSVNYTVDCRLHGCSSPSQNPVKLLTSIPARLLTSSKLHSRLPPPWLHVNLAKSCKITHKPQTTQLTAASMVASNYTVDCRLHGCTSPSQFLQDYSQAANYTVDCRLHGCTSPSQNPVKLLKSNKLHSRLPPPRLHVNLAESRKITHKQQTTQVTGAFVVARQP